MATHITEADAIPGFRIGTLGPLLVGVWTHSGKLDSLQVFERVELELVERFPKISTLVVITGDPRGADPEMKSVSDQLAKKFELKVRGSAIAVLARGFSGVMARAFLGVFSLIAPTIYPTKIFSDLEGACAWLQRLPGQAGEVSNAGDLNEAVKRFVAGALERPAPPQPA